MTPAEPCLFSDMYSGFDFLPQQLLGAILHTLILHHWRSTLHGVSVAFNDLWWKGVLARPASPKDRREQNGPGHEVAGSGESTLSAFEGLCTAWLDQQVQRAEVAPHTMALIRIEM